MILLGLNFFGDPFRFSGDWTEENEIGRLWKRFLAYLQENEQRIKHAQMDGPMYEVHVQHEMTPRTGECEVFVGIEVEKLEDVPVLLSAKILPAVTYAVFTFRGKQIVSDWGHWIFDEWLPQSDFESAYPYGFQYYDERFKGLERLEESVLDVYIPVRKIKQDA